MKKSIILTAAVGLSMMLLAGCGGEKYGYEDAKDYTLNKCDASSEKLVTVGVGGPWSYDDDNSSDEEYMYLDHEDGGYIWIGNEAYDPLYTYAGAYVSNESVDSSYKEYIKENGYEVYDCDFEVIGTAFDGSDLILAKESYVFNDGSSESDVNNTYLLIEYSDDGLIEFLTVDFYGMEDEIGDWTDDEMVELARNLFGK